MFKKLLLLLLLVAPLSMIAQEKIGYINANEIFSVMPEFTEAQGRLKVKSDAMEKNATGIEAEFNALVNKFKESTEEPTASLVADREKQMQQLRERYEQFLQTSQQELEEAQQKEFAPIRQKIQDAIKKVGDENNFTYIADSSVFMYISPSAINANPLVKTKLGIK